MSSTPSPGLRRALAGVVAATVVPLAVLHRLGRTWGATLDERLAPLPGDDVVPDPDLQTTHAATIDAPPAAVWPWLVQMGWHQGGWYTSRWVDRLLFPANWPSATTILPGLQDRRVGDFIPDGPPESGCGFVIEGLTPREALVLHSTTHLPMAWRRAGARLDWTWVFVLVELEGGRTRLVFRCRGTAGPWWVLGLYHLAIVPADFVMSRQLLHGVRVRAEAPGPVHA